LLAPEYTPEVSGGVGTHAFELTQGLVRAGHRVWVLAYTTASSRVIDGERFSVHFMAPAAPGDRTLSMVGQILRFNDELVTHALALLHDETAPDLVQSYNWVTFRAARTLGDVWNVPVVSSIHYVSEPIERWWGQSPDSQIVAEEAHMCRCADASIVVSESLGRVVRETYGLAQATTSVVRNALDSDMFHPCLAPEQRQRLRARLAPAGSRIVMFAGRLSPTKGILQLIDSADHVVRARQDVAYVIAGQPDSREFGALVREAVAKYPALEDRVRFVGKVPRAQLPILYAAADLAVVPSVYESFGYAAVEAMACGVPVIASAVGGLAEILEDGRSGIAVEVRERADGTRCVDIEGLTAAQLRLLDDPEHARRLGDAGRRRVQERFTLDGMVRQTLAVYTQVLRSSAGRSAGQGRH
jgi:glycosyltransferase involved in cell wall biosynthesis